MSNFEFDDRAFQRELDKVARKGLEEIYNKYQRLFDRITARYQGRSLEEIKAALWTEWRREGGDISDPELTQYAQAIFDGRRIEVGVG